MSYRSSQFLRCRVGGFTIIELVIVVLILSVAAAVVMPRMAVRDSTLPAQADQFARMLRHAQFLAMAQGRALNLDILTANSYVITDGTNPIADPSGIGDQVNYTFNNGVTVVGADIRFDSLGRPIDAGGLITNAQTWTLSNGTSNILVSVAPVTGFVTLTP